jgi:hypothetical protein
MKLSELDPKSVQIGQRPASKALKLSALPPEQVKISEPDESFVGSLEKGGLLGGLGYIGSGVDRVTGAPVRAGIYAAQNGENPLSAAVSQVFKKSETAPTGKQIVEKAGVPDTALSEVVPSLYSDSGEGMTLKKGGILDPTASGAAGFAMDLAADPTTLLPAVGLAKRAAQGTKLAEAGGKLLDRIPTMAKATAKMGETFTGVPEKATETYIKNTDAVNALSKRLGGDISLGADELRSDWQSQLRNRKNSLGKQLQDVVDTSSPNRTVNISPVLDRLQTYQSKLNPNLKSEDVAQLKELLDKTRGELPSLGETVAGPPSPYVSPKSLKELKDFYQERGKSAYMKNGQIFNPSPEAAKAAKIAGADTRKLFNAALPEGAEVNNQLSLLHQFEDGGKYGEKINKNLITPEKPDTALLAIGNGTNPRGKRMLDRFSKVTGQDVLPDVNNLAAARQFGKTSLVSVDNTGKGVERMLKASVLPAVLGHPVAAAVAAGLTSPLALKAAVNAGNVSKKMIQALSRKTGPLTDIMVKDAFRALQTPEGQVMYRALQESSRPDFVEQMPEALKTPWDLSRGK